METVRVLVVTNMYPAPAQPAFGTFIREQVESLIQAGVDVDVFAFSGSGGAKSYLKAARAFQRRLHSVNQQPYDLVHAHYGLSGVIARMQTRYPVVVTFHGSDLLGGVGDRYQYTLLGAAVAVISNLVGLAATRCIVVADVQRPRLWSRSAITIPMGVNLDLFKPMASQVAKERIGLDQDKRHVLFVAHPNNSTKRFDVAYAAVELIQDDDPDVELLPVYDTPHNQIPLYMNACDVLVLTSMHEASPCVIKEALACNLPIVSVNVGDVAERIHSVEGCYLCERTPQDVAYKLRQALVGGRLIHGRERIRPLSLQNVAQTVIALYRQILALDDIQEQRKC
jgi:teichuronic acid biosynthesis glycosyltransferase TuaC